MTNRVLVSPIYSDSIYTQPIILYSSSTFVYPLYMHTHIDMYIHYIYIHMDMYIHVNKANSATENEHTSLKIGRWTGVSRSTVCFFPKLSSFDGAKVSFQ